MEALRKAIQDEKRYHQASPDLSDVRESSSSALSPVFAEGGGSDRPEGCEASSEGARSYQKYRQPSGVQIVPRIGQDRKLRHITGTKLMGNISSRSQAIRFGKAYGKLYANTFIAVEGEKKTLHVGEVNKLIKHISRTGIAVSKQSPNVPKRWEKIVNYSFSKSAVHVLESFTNTLVGQKS